MEEFISNETNISIGAEKAESDADFFSQNSSKVSNNGEPGVYAKADVLRAVNIAKEKEINEKIGNFSSKIDSTFSNSNGLRVGCLQFGDDRNKCGKFVYVPANFDFTTNDGMQSILEALDIDEPDLVFSFPRNHGIVPSTKKKEKLQEWETSRKKNFIPFRLPKSPTQQAISPLEPTHLSHDLKKGDRTRLLSKAFSAAEDERNTEIPVSPGMPQTDECSYEKQSINGNDLSSMQKSESFLVGGRKLQQNTGDPRFKNINDKELNHFDISAFADPNDAGDNNHIRKVEADVNNLFSAIAGFRRTLFLITKPFRGNTLSEIACSAAADSRTRTVSLGLFHTDDHDLGGNFTVLKDTSGAIYNVTEYEERLVKDARERSTNKFSDAWSDRTDTSKEQFRMPVPSSVFELDCVAKGEVPQRAIRIDCDFSEFERAVYNENRHVQHIPGGLANECSHRLVFATSIQKKAFSKTFSEFYATGYFACGGTHSEMLTAIKALKSGQPLFIIRGTGAVPTVTEEFIRREIRKSKIRLARATLHSRMSLDTDDAYNVERFSSKAALDEACWLAEANTGMFNNLNTDAHYVIKHKHDDDEAMSKHGTAYIQTVKNEITKVMATAFNYNNEIGGEEKDRRAIDLCDELSMDIARAKRRYQLQAVFIQVLIRVIIILTTTSTVMTIHCLGKKESININEVDVNVYDMSQRKFCRAHFLTSMDTIGLVLPIVAAALQALEKTLRPNTKYGNLLLAQCHLESEKFKFRARIAVYSSLDRSRGHTYSNARKTFMERCNAIYGECIDSEVKEGTLNTYSRSKQILVDTLLSRIVSTCRAIIAFSTCKPLNLRMNGDASQERFVMPSNWLVKFFRSRHGYELWQGNEMRKILKAYKDREENDLLDVEEQRLRTVEQSAARFGLTHEEEITFYHMCAKEYKVGQNEKYQIISLDEYVLLRLIPTQEKFMRLLPRYVFWRNTCQVLLVALTGVSTLFVALDREIVVPIALAAAATADAFLTFFHLESRAPVLHVAASELRKILLDIEGLDILEKRLRSNKREFIERSENAILANYEFLVESALKFGTKEEKEFEEKLDEKYLEVAESLKRKKE